jgi:hypothetical protein
LWDLQGAIGEGRLQIFDGKAPLRDDFFPEMRLAKTESASTVVKYPARARQPGLLFMA